jgi:hypothetical protein
MIEQAIFGGGGTERQIGLPNKTPLLLHVHPAIGRILEVRAIFTRFQNLNLRVLIEDLRRGLVTHGEWVFADNLCPVAHGLVGGQSVSGLHYLSQAVDLPRACRSAADELGVPPGSVERFVAIWDAGGMSHEWLLDKLEAIWWERQEDADAMQEFLAAQSEGVAGA